MEEQLINSENKNATEVAEPVMFPTEPDSEGFFYEDAEEKEDNIRTKKYTNGRRSKFFELSDGRKAVVREMTGADSVEISKIQGNKKEGSAEDDYMPIVMWKSCKIDDKHIPMEDFKEMSFKDYNRILLVTTGLNF